MIISENFELVEHCEEGIDKYYKVIRTTRTKECKLFKEELRGVLIRKISDDSETKICDEVYEVTFLISGRRLEQTRIFGNNELVKLLELINVSEVGRNIKDWNDILFFTGRLSSSRFLEIYINNFGIKELQNDLNWLKQCGKISE